MSLREFFVKDKRPTLAALFLICLVAAILFAYVPGGTSVEVLWTIGAVGTGCVLGWKLIQAMLRQSIWRLRNRLIVTYVFIGVVPLALVIALIAIGTYIFAGQTAMYLVSSELDRTIGGLGLPAAVLSHNEGSPPASVLDQVAPYLRQHFPQFAITVQQNGKITHYPANSDVPATDPAAAEYSGLAVRNGVYCVWSHSTQGGRTVDVTAPVESEMLANLVPHLGRVELSGDNGHLARRRRANGGSLAADPNAVPAAANQFDFQVTWPSAIKVVDWGTEKNLDSDWLLITTRPFALMSAIFGGEKFSIAIGFLYALGAVALLFLLVEIVSLMIGVSLTRTITGAMQNLYEGTRRVAEGDFAHRIPVKGKDQLAAVTTSFNSMTERLERLVVVEKEKERLQSELEIAREVQDQLFPNCGLRLKSLEIDGLCRPARMVSGDYYDYLCLQDSNMALAIGDVAGKGISAALLMASIQSIMRTQLSSVSPVMAATANGVSRSTYSTSKMVSQLNHQLYLNTAPEKYATFLFGVYDEDDRVFTYTNAGHLPPILIRGADAQFLEVTGTVVGAFPTCRYEEQRVHLEPGDLLVCYTDGITEPENEYGEEFGTDRLVETIVKNHKLEGPELVNRVMDAVRSWTTAPELPDDMTVVLARGV